MGITLDELIFDPSNPDDGANVGAHVRAGDDGTAIGHVSDSLKVNISNATLDVSGSEVALDAASLAALENITVTVDNSEVEISNDIGNPIPISDAGGSVTVDAVDLDVRDLAFATDSVDVSGSEVSLDAATLAALESVTVSATDLDIRDLAFATDKVDASGSEVSLDAATLAALESITVSATDLDIRDLTFASDKVDASGSVVQQDSYDTIKNTAQSITSTASAIAGTPLANRVRMNIQNLGNKEIYIGSSSGVTSANGTKLSAGSSADFMFSAASTPFAITPSGTADVRILEMAY